MFREREERQPKQFYVLKADLVGFRGIHRTIAIHSDLTLVDVHYALQAAFDGTMTTSTRSGTDGEFYSHDGREYTHPFHAARRTRSDSSLEDLLRASTEIRLNPLKLNKGQRLTSTSSTSATNGGCI